MRAAPIPEIAVVVATYGRPGLLPRLVDALAAQTLDRDRFEVVLVDNGSHDGTGELLQELVAAADLRAKILTIAENRGPAPARNAGWRASVAPYVAFTDDDCVPAPTWLVQALSSCRATPDLAVLQGATLRPRGPYPYGFRTSYRETITPSPYFEGSNLVFPRSILEETGGFDESFHFGGEDTVAGWAAIATGGRWLFDETCAVTHDVSERPLRWHLMMAWREGVLVDVARRYPEFRRTGFWRPRIHAPRNGAFVVGVASTMATVVTPWTLLGWVPWVWIRRPRTRHPVHAGVNLAFRFVNDAVAEVGMVRGSIRNRTLVL